METPTRSAIHEANRHLQALYQQIDHLTSAIHDRNKLLDFKEQEQQNILKLSAMKDSQIFELQNNLKTALEKTETLEKISTENRNVIDELRKKERILNQILSFKPSLEGLVALISQHSASLSSDSGLSVTDSTTHSADQGLAQKSDVYMNSSIRRIVHHHQRRKKQFSISEDDAEMTDSESETSEEKAKRKEVYF